VSACQGADGVAGSPGKGVVVIGKGGGKVSSLLQVTR